MRNCLIIIVLLATLSSCKKESVKPEFISAEELMVFVNVEAKKIGYLNLDTKTAENISLYLNFQITKRELRELSDGYDKTTYAIWHNAILETLEYETANELLQIISGDYKLQDPDSKRKKPEPKYWSQIEESDSIY